MQTFLDDINLTKQSFYPINSESVIRNIHSYNKRVEKNLLNEKKNLDSEIRKTTYNVKLKKYSKFVDLNKIRNKENKVRGENLDEVFHGEKYPQNQSKTFSEFISRKRIKNMYLKSRMKLFSNVVSDRTKATIQREINNEVNKINERRTINVQQSMRSTLKSTNSYLISQEFRDKQRQKTSQIKRYTICHMILDRVLALMAENPNYISLKHQHPQIYNSLKEQMLEILVSSDHIISAMKTFDDVGQIKMARTKQNEDFTVSRAKIKQIQNERKPFYLLKQQKKDQLAQQITNILDIVHDMIEKALRDLDKPELAYYLQQQWQKREGNFASTTTIASLKKETSCLRSTTFLRFRKTGSTF